MCFQSQTTSKHLILRCLDHFVCLQSRLFVYVLGILFNGLRVLLFRLLSVEGRSLLTTQMRKSEYTWVLPVMEACKMAYDTTKTIRPYDDGSTGLLPGVDADFINPFDYVETFDTSSKRAKYVVDAYRYGCK